MNLLGTCVLSCSLALIAACESASSPTPTGTLRINVEIRGLSSAAADTDGVDLVVDTRPPFHTTAVLGLLVLTDIAAGQHTIAVQDVEPNCVLGQPNPETATVQPDSVTQHIISGVCY